MHSVWGWILLSSFTIKMSSVESENEYQTIKQQRMTVFEIASVDYEFELLNYQLQ